MTGAHKFIVDSSIINSAPVTFCSNVQLIYTIQTTWSVEIIKTESFQNMVIKYGIIRALEHFQE